MCERVAPPPPPLRQPRCAALLAGCGVGVRWSSSLSRNKCPDGVPMRMLRAPGQAAGCLLMLPSVDWVCAHHVLLGQSAMRGALHTHDCTQGPGLTHGDVQFLPA